MLYQRNKRVADLLTENFGDTGISVVDVGGGTGLMSHFLPGVHYLLCEPSINSMRSEDLVEAGRRFDVVLSTHVFEHIPDDVKGAFVESLLSISERGVILCNPVDTGDPVEMHEFLLDVYGPLGWIVGHMKAGIPTLDTMRDLADRHALDLQIHPNGNRLLSMALFAMATLRPPPRTRKC